MFSSTFLVLSLACSAYGALFITSPVGSTTLTGGQEATISWQDDGESPSLADFGDAKVSIYAGNALQQTQLQEIVPSVNVATTSSIQFTPDPSIGPDSSEYFIRFESLNLKDAAAPQYPALSFSAKFTMNGMTGTFSAEVQAQIEGQSTAPLAGQTSAATSRTSTTSDRTTSSTSSSSRTGTANAAAATESSSEEDAAFSVSVASAKVWMTATVCVMLGVFLF